MITIDGSAGEGGGQILRSALALSTVTGKPVQLERIRARRSKPGLLRQHLTAVLAAAKISGAELDGAHLGSRELRFVPAAVHPGHYQFAIGSAGSTTLVLQTILPALITASGRSTLLLEGGTHNPHAPPFEFLELSFLPLINRMGPKVTASVERHGFYPAGGGRITIEIEPAARLIPFDLVERSKIVGCKAMAIVAGLRREIGDRELAVIGREMEWPADSLHVRHLPAGHGQGNALLLEIASANLTEVITAFGQRGIRAEQVAESAAAEAREYLDSEVPVGPHLADQLLLPMALAGGGSFVTMPITMHAQTNIETIRRFLDVEVTVGGVQSGGWLVRVAER
ncbi:MAG TPA: RNA 3'-terminal phosphate cyclase [Pirellulales bacterium]|nr:RNA 3'-terminal phosphate cyclase [Pirellulales bacterium]